MNDKAVALLEQYDIEVIRVRKGRGAFLCDTDKGVLIFKEYVGTEGRLALQNHVQQYVEGKGSIKTDAIIPTKEGALFVKDKDGTRYILKTYFEGRECNIYEKEECLLAMELLAELHNSMQDVPPMEDVQCTPADNVLQEYEKRNKELVRIRNFLRGKKQKQVFERELYRVMEPFLEQARSVTENWREYVQELHLTEEADTYYHGNYQYHNIIFYEDEWYVINFEKCQQGSQVRDVFLLLRKLLEKNDWQPDFGKELLEAYCKKRPLSAYEAIDLYYRLAYPEKFWKIVNFYYNTSKAWIPQRNLEKLMKVLEQEKNRQVFLEEMVEGIYFEKPGN